LVHTLNKSVALEIHKKIFLIRETEEKIAREYGNQKMRCPVHLSIGQEVVPAVLSDFLNNQDFVVSTHRGHAHYIAKNGNLKKMIAEIYGKVTGCSKGNGGSMHLIDKSVGFYGTSAIVGNSIPIGVGLSFDLMKSKNKNLSVVYLGDGAIEEGSFYESLNLAAVKKLPTLFVCENNLYSVYSPLSVRQPKNRNINKMVKSIGVDSLESDGNDIKKVFNSCKMGINYVRNNRKPFFLFFNNYRWREHCGPNYDNNIGYRTEKEFKDWKKYDPLLISYQVLKKFKISDKVIKEIEKVQISKIISAFKFAEKSKFPDKKQLMKNIYR
jgi:TPP-dependent pyruvate/acetoin dehydrogenase alpha subunit